MSSPINRQHHSLFYPTQSHSCGVVNCLLHPGLKNQHVRIHSESIRARTTNSPADDACEIPLVIAGTDQRSSTISFAWINSSLRETCAAHALRNSKFHVAVCPLTRFTWYKRYFRFLQNLKSQLISVKCSSPLRIVPTIIGTKTIFCQNNKQTKDIDWGHSFEKKITRENPQQFIINISMGSWRKSREFLEGTMIQWTISPYINYSNLMGSTK